MASGVYTHAYTHARLHSCIKEISKNKVRWLQPARAWFKNIATYIIDKYRQVIPIAMYMAATARNIQLGS